MLTIIIKDVPNALMFIDKYTQISRILNPIIIALRRVAELMKDADLRDCIISLFRMTLFPFSSSLFLLSFFD